MDCPARHVHHLARHPPAAADFITHYGGTLFTPRMECMKARHVSAMLEGSEIRIRGVQPNETGNDKQVDVGFRHLGIQVDDLDSFAARQGKAGETFTENPGPGVPASMTAFIKAPDGVMFEFIEEC